MCAIGRLRRRAGTAETRWTEELATLLPADPTAWLDAEWLNIRAAVEHSAELGLALLATGRHTLRQAAELLESSGFHAEAAQARAEAEGHRLCG